MILSLHQGFAKETGVKFDIPIREHSIIIGPEGFFPARISLFEGEKLKIYFGSVKEGPSCLMVRGKQFFLTVNGKEIIESEIYFDTPGTFEYYCPSENYKGTITVLPRNGGRKAQDRQIASEKNRGEENPLVKVWLPKETP